jgi:hypothetical protein
VKAVRNVQLVAETVTEIGNDRNIIFRCVDIDRLESGSIKLVDLDMLFFVEAVDVTRLYDLIIRIRKEVDRFYKLLQVAGNGCGSSLLALVTAAIKTKHLASGFHGMPFVLHINKLINDRLSYQGHAQVFRGLDEGFNFRFQHSCKIREKQPRRLPGTPGLNYR